MGAEVQCPLATVFSTIATLIALPVLYTVFGGIDPALLSETVKLFYRGMILILAAMMDELRVPMDLCSQRTRLPQRGIRLWRGVRRGKVIHFLKTGVGPAHAVKSLELAFKTLSPNHLTVIGYAGALDGSLKIGDLVVGTHARLLETDSGDDPNGDGADLSFALAGTGRLLNLGIGRGLSIQKGGIITSDRIVGNPVEKLRLHELYRASIVDMETAALARLAHSRGISIECIRAITDEAEDDLLAPFGEEAGPYSIGMVAKVLKAGRWKSRYKGWKAGVTAARTSLKKFFEYYIDSLPNL